ncbi:MAG: hypothetical protein H7Z17_07535 [Fuerstia sp.]|nr:hypothetical protein [Fuerstiella sp.]
MTTEQRLQKLERQNRLWKVGVVCLGAVLLMGATRNPICPTIQAQKFELMDACGKARAELTMENGLPRLVFIQSDHSRNTFLGIDRDPSEGERAVLSLSNPDGSHCLHLKATENSAELFLNGGRSRNISLAARSDNTAKPFIRFNDETGVRVRIDSAPDRSRLQLFDTLGNPTFNAP